MHALILCQNQDEVGVLRFAAERAGLTSHSLARLERALKDWSERPADLVVLALRQRDMVDAVRQLRRETHVPLVVVGDGWTEDVLCALLDAGADRLVQRPYAVRILAAELRALLRRSEGATLLTVPLVTVGDISLDPSTRTVVVHEGPRRRLTPLEFRLLYTLMAHRGQVLPTPILVERIWGYDGEGSGELVRGLVSRLRAKVEDVPREPRYILNVPGVGYRLGMPEG